MSAYVLFAKSEWHIKGCHNRDLPMNSFETEALEVLSHVRLLLDALSGSASTLDLAPLFEYRRRCVQLGASVPAFVASFLDEIASLWACDVVAALPCAAGWRASDVALLQVGLLRAMEIGLRYATHATCVDEFRNPCALLQFVQCMLLVWGRVGRDADKFTPMVVQTLTRLRRCSRESFLLIADYATIGGFRSARLVVFLSRVHACMSTCCTDGKFSTQVARECFECVQMDDGIRSALETAAAELDRTWSFLTGNDPEVPIAALPGLAGSHVAEVEIPCTVAVRGTPAVVVNCVCSALLLSRRCDTAAAPVRASRDMPCVGRLPHELMRFARARLVHASLCEARGLAWAKEHRGLAEQLLLCMASDLGLSGDRTVSLILLMGEVDMLRVSMAPALGVPKAACAAKLFDWVAHAIESKCAVVGIKWPEDKTEAVCMGRVLVDIERVNSLTQDKVQVDSKLRTIHIKKFDHAMAFLKLVVDYAIECAAPRRKRGECQLVKRNVSALPSDKRRKRDRPVSAAGS